MKRIALFFLLTLFILTPSAFSQDDDWYRPGGFDAIGRSYKTFSVSDTKKVHFSRGNLQYNAAQNKWRFAPRQYTYVCSDNNNISQDYDGWIDLFGWGTSGWVSGANAYQPWSTSTTASDYYIGGDYVNGLYGEYANADWGVYNKITNGGNKAGQWRTLSMEEWSYLLSPNRGNGQYKNALATIQGVFKGMIILPDEWTTPDGLTFTPGGWESDGYATNTYTIDEWQRMEAAGAIFLPTTGRRTGDDISSSTNNEYVEYWSSDHYDETKAHCIFYRSDYDYSIYKMNRYYGLPVRLVRDYKPEGSGAFDQDGASLLQFSVSDTSTVRFSKGNLRYNAAINQWAFAAKQYLYKGEANANISSSYNGWIDLFGWGTSGWSESGANAFQPWATSTTASDYYPGGSATSHITGEYAKADWGVHNRISNGGDKVGKWRTLTMAEWTYLLGDNAIRSGKCGHATIQIVSKSYTGIVILPDDWTTPSGVTFTAGYAHGFNTNTYTANQWQRMESAGAIFLPSSGDRDGTSVDGVGTYGHYWSSSNDNSGDVYDVYFDESELWPTCYAGRSNGFSVRLVKD